MAEDATQEERERHLRHAVAGRHRWLGYRASNHRELPDADSSSQRARPRTADRGHLSPLRTQRPPDRDPRTRDSKRDYYCQSRRGNRLFELGLSEVALALTAASSKTDQTAIAKIFAEHGRAGFAAAWLRHRGLDWALPMLFQKEVVT